MSMRVGMGYDVHRLAEDRKMILGGVEIPYEKGLLGHSDADVLVHAIMDALLGAAALGDIGKHFPDTDPEYKGISSIRLLKHVGGLLDENRYMIENIDATVIAQRPKMRPYIDTMRQNIADALCIEIDQVNVKATTEEGLGFTGDGEGISSQAICAIEMCIRDSLKRFFSENAGKKYIFLVDEAHNLVERGREMYSARLYKEDFLELKKMMRVKEPILSKKADEVNRQFLLLKRECEEYRVLESVSHLAIKLMNLLAEMERFFEKSSESDKRDQVLELYFKVREFLNIHDILDENYVIYSEYQQDGRFMVKLFCVNPAVNLQAYLEYGIGTVFFSATLLPVRYYKKLLSIETDDYAIYADSPFPKDSRLLLIGRDVSTRSVSYTHLHLI